MYTQEVFVKCIVNTRVSCKLGVHTRQINKCKLNTRVKCLYTQGYVGYCRENTMGSCKFSVHKTGTLLNVC